MGFIIILALIIFIVGIFFAFDIPGAIKARAAARAEATARENEEGTGENRPKKKSLSANIAYYKGGRGFFLQEELLNAEKILGETGRASEYRHLVFSCVLCSCAGALFGLIIGNLPAIIILAAGMFMIPIWRLKLYRNKYKKFLSAQLESSLSLITTSYLRTNDLILAFQENVEQSSTLVRPYFRDFLSETMINPSLKNCVRNLRDKINDNIFKEWCNEVLRTLDNSQMKEALIPIVEKYSTVRVVQDQIDSEVGSAIVEYVIMMLMSVVVYPMVYFLNKDWFAYYNTFFGQFIVAYTIIVLLFSITKLIGVGTPVEYRR